MAESSTHGRKEQAVQAMLALGFGWVDIDVALEDLLQFYDYKWDYIESNNYYQLVDWILNRRPPLSIYGRESWDEHWGEEAPKPAVSELVRLEQLNPLLMPSEKPVRESELTEVEGQKDQERSMQPSSPNSPLQRVNCMDPADDQPLSHEISRRLLKFEAERSRAEVEKGKQISEDTEMERGELEETREDFKYYFDPRYAESLNGNKYFRGLVDSRRKMSHLDLSILEPKVTREYLSDTLISTRMWLGQETLMQSETATSNSELHASKKSTCKPLELDKIHLLVKEMTLEYFAFTSLASNLSSCSNSETTSNLDSSLEDAEGKL